MYHLFLRKFISFLVSISLLVGVGVYAHADTINITAEQEKILKMVNDMMTPTQNPIVDIVTNTKLDTSSFYEAMASLDNTAFGKLKYEVPSGTDSTALLNLEYNNLVKAYKEAGYGQNNELIVPKPIQGYSQSIQEQFATQFGDLKYKMENSARLPDGWDVNTLMEQAQKKRQEASQSVMQSDLYKNVLNTISINASFVQGSANKRDEYQTWFNSQMEQNATGAKAEWNKDVAKGFDEIKKIASQNSLEVPKKPADKHKTNIFKNITSAISSLFGKKETSSQNNDLSVQEATQKLFESNVNKTNTWLKDNIDTSLGDSGKFDIFKQAVEDSKDIFEGLHDDINGLLENKVENKELEKKLQQEISQNIEKAITSGNVSPSIAAAH